MHPSRLSRLHVVLALAVTVLTAAATQTAPAPKPVTDPRAPELGEPVEPTVDSAKVASNPLLAVQESRNRVQSVNNLKQIALAMHNFEAVNRHLPSNVTDKDGKPLLSWRVELLPYLEQEGLFRQFKRDEPWDSENNLKMLTKMPKIFESPRAVVKKKGYTVYQGFAGPGSVFDPDRKGPLTFAGITDGTSSTILAVEAPTTVPWTKPADLPFDPNKDLPDFGKIYGKQALAATCDGAVHVLNIERVKPETLKSAITVAGGELLPQNWDR